MDGALAIVLISLAMFVGCFLLGMIPVLFRLSEQKLRFVSVFGAGLLCGTALAVIIPEGVELMEESWKASMCFNLSGSEVSSSSSSSPDVSSRTGLPPNFLIGVSLVIGFTLMFVVDQIGTYCSIHDPQTGMSNSTSVTATLGLVIHAATDGIALGAAVASSQVSVQVIVFFAVILHKAPAAFGLVTFLMHAGVQRRVVQKHLLAFSAAAPVLAITTYFILHATGGASWPSAVGIGMLFSAGTFLYVAMVHVLPEINSRGHHHPNGMQQHSGTPAYQQGGLGILESLLLISGTALPTLLTLGLHDD